MIYLALGLIFVGWTRSRVHRRLVLRRDRSDGGGPVNGFPLADAAICLDCELVFRLTGSGGRCSCSSESLAPLERFLNRDGIKPAVEQLADLRRRMAAAMGEPESGGMVPA